MITGVTRLVSIATCNSMVIQIAQRMSMSTDRGKVSNSVALNAFFCEFTDALYAVAIPVATKR